MTRDGEIAAIFNPRRVRAPSVVVTGDSSNGPFGGFTNIINSTTTTTTTTNNNNATTVTNIPHLVHSDSIASGQPDGVDSVVCISGNNVTGANTPTPTIETAPTLTLPSTAQISSPNKCKDSCCSELAQKVFKILN